MIIVLHWHWPSPGTGTTTVILLPLCRGDSEVETPSHHSTPHNQYASMLMTPVCLSARWPGTCHVSSGALYFCINQLMYLFLLCCELVRSMFFYRSVFFVWLGVNVSPRNILWKASTQPVLCPALFPYVGISFLLTFIVWQNQCDIPTNSISRTQTELLVRVSFHSAILGSILRVSQLPITK